MIMPLPVTGESFAVERLREDPNLDYNTLRQQASEEGISMQPIHYGRARRQLGLPVLRDSRDVSPATPVAAVVEQPVSPAIASDARQLTAAPAVP